MSGAAPEGTSASSPKGLAFGPSAFGFAACRHRMYRRLVSPSRGNKKAILPQNVAACRGRMRRRPISSTRGKEKGCFAGIPLPQNRCPHEEATEVTVGHTAEDNGQILSRCPHDTPADSSQTRGTVDNESAAEASRPRAEWWSRGHISPEPFFGDGRYVPAGATGKAAAHRFLHAAYGLGRNDSGATGTKARPPTWRRTRRGTWRRVRKWLSSRLP